MEKEEINAIITRYLDGSATDKDNILMESWYAQLHEDTSVEVSLSHRLEQLNQVKSAIDKKLGLISADDTHGSTERNTWPYVIAVAATIICVLCILLYPVKKTDKSVEPVLVQTQDILPGTNKAVLVLADGKKINLSNAGIGHLAVQKGAKIAKVAAGEITYQYNGNDAGDYNKIETPNGGTYMIHLPDGTNVWLNAASTLKYPTSFSSLKERRVELSGEAYFEVAKNKQLPFRVVAKNQVVEVVGTHFNISSYANEKVMRTTLLEGSVSINKNILLKPGEQAVNSASGIRVNEVDATNAIDWKAGKFSFGNDQDFQTAMRQVERWYDVKFVYTNLPEVELRGRISRTTNLADVLDKIEDMGKVHFRIEGRRIIVTQ